LPDAWHATPKKKERGKVSWARDRTEKSGGSENSFIPKQGGEYLLVGHINGNQIKEGVKTSGNEQGPKKNLKKRTEKKRIKTQELERRSWSPHLRKEGNARRGREG